ncbi:MAG: AMIN domain-containing protein [Candidatus Rokubacteria bacterium]|nr:AMIN domain-containing protein [Candidatus Rokubacteria bacterium]
MALNVALLLLAPIAPAKAQTAQMVLSNVTVTSQPDALTVHVTTSREPRYRAELIDTPSRLIVDLEDAVYAWRKTPLAVGAEPLRQIRGSQYRKGIARVVFDLTRDVGYAIREEEDGLTIIIPTAAPGATRSVVMKDDAAAPAPAAAPAAPAPAPAPAAPPEPARVAPAPIPAPVRLAQAPAAQPSNGSRLISFDFKDADVVNLLRILAAESAKNIVIGDDVKGKMSMSLRNVPWDLAFSTVLETRGLQKVEKDGVIRIVSNEQLLKEREAQARVEESKLKAETDIRTKAAEAKLKEQEALDRQRAAEAAFREAQARGPLKEETIRLAYADPDELVKTLQGILGLTGGAPSAPPPVAPPFSAVYGQPAPPGAPPATPSAEVLAKGITIQAHKPTNSIFIRHYEADLERIKKLIKEKLDVPLPQVKIEARMNELNRTDFFALGVSWGGAGTRRVGSETALVGQGFAGRAQPTGGVAPIPPAGPLALSQFLPISAVSGLPLGGNLVDFPVASTLGTPAGLAFGIVGRKLNLNFVLDALEALNKTTSLAKPEIVTVENATASIKLGSEIPYATVSSAGTQIQFKEAVLKLEVTPTVIREGDITKVKLVVFVENNSRGANTVTTGGEVPAIDKREAKTQVIVKEGETLVIGGIRQRQDSETTRKVPLFGDIPVFGFLFRAKSRSIDPNRELIVFITPYVLKLEVAQAPPPPAKK